MAFLIFYDLDAQMDRASAAADIASASRKSIVSAGCLSEYFALGKSYEQARQVIDQPKRQTSDQASNFVARLLSNARESLEERSTSRKLQILECRQLSTTNYSTCWKH